MSNLSRTVEALLFLSSEPLDREELADAASCSRDEIDAAM